MLNKIVDYFLDNRLVAMLLLVIIIVWGISTASFNWHGGIIPSNPVAVDAIPDIGDNQQIVATEWMGRSPKDIQDQITYPLTTSLLGIPGVKTIRSSSSGMSDVLRIQLEIAELDNNIKPPRSRATRYHKEMVLSIEAELRGIEPNILLKQTQAEL